MPLANATTVLSGSRRASRRLMIEALRTWPDRPAAPSAETLQAADLGWIVEAADHHGIGPALYTYLYESPGTPREVLATLRRAHTAQVIRHLRVIADVRSLTGAFGAAQLRWVAVKGPVLAELYWGRTDLRRYSDLDIVVDASALAAVLDLLTGLGARLIDVNWAMISRQLRGELSVELPTGTVLDLHWHVVNEQRIRERLGFNIGDMLARRRLVAIGGVETPTWDAADTLLHTAYHCASSGAHRLIWIKDVQLTASHPGLDWDDVVRRAGDFRLTLLLGAVLKRVEHVFGPLPVPPDIMARLRSRSPWLAMTAIADRLTPPTVQPWRGPSGRAAYQSIRDSTPATMQAFARKIPVAIRSRRRPPVSDLPENPLHTADNDDVARRAFLRQVGIGG